MATTSDTAEQPIARAGGVEAVERALSLLMVFEKPGQALSLADLAVRTGLYKSTILRLVHSLERFHILVRDPDGRYRPGAELWRLGGLCGPEFDLEPLIRPVLSRLVDATGETASFYIRRGNHRVCRYRLNSFRAVRYHLEEGERLPLDRGAAGRVLLAFGGQDGADQRLIRERGFYVSHGERDPEVSAVAVPLIDRAGLLRGALAVSGLRARFTGEVEARALAALKAEAAALAPRLPVAPAEAERTGAADLAPARRKVHRATADAPRQPEPPRPEPPTFRGRRRNDAASKPS